MVGPTIAVQIFAWQFSSSLSPFCAKIPYVQVTEIFPTRWSSLISLNHSSNSTLLLASLASNDAHTMSPRRVHAHHIVVSNTPIFSSTNDIEGHTLKHSLYLMWERWRFQVAAMPSESKLSSPSFHLLITYPNNYKENSERAESMPQCFTQMH